MVGQNIGKYRVLDRVGRGGMGTVYRAIDETLHREVAIKILNAELDDPEVARRFRTEAIAVARLSHPGIATIYELFEHDDRWLMVMEFVRGETLEHLVARLGALAPQQAAALCRQSLAALDHAHAMGVVHRDLKPANIMRTDSGDIKIMDFGIARVSGTERLTTVGFMMGTPAYMAPEQVVGNDIDARADLYAIGVVFFRLLTGQLPFRGETPFAMAQAQVNAPPTPIAELRQDLPAWVGEILRRALEKKPEDRFQTAVAFDEALEAALTGAETAAAGSAASVLPPAVPVSQSAAREPVAAAEPGAPASSAPRAAVPLSAGRMAGLATAVLLLAAAGWWLLVPEPSAPEPVAPVPLSATAPQGAPPETGAPVARDVALPLANTPSSAPPDDAPVAARPAAPATSTPAVTPEPEPPADTAPPVEIAEVRVLVVDGRRTTDHDVRLNLADGKVVAVSADDGAPLMTWPYSAVTGVTYVHGRSPQWNNALASPPDDLDVGGLFRTSRHYLTLQNQSEYVILRLEDINVVQVIRELEARTGLAIRGAPGSTAGDPD